MKNYYIISGGFDPLHEGHVHSIIDSKNNSDGVIVLLNSDSWLKRKKGKEFMNFNTRKIIMENMKGVIDVIEFNDDDNSACDGLKLAREKYADCNLVFAKGGDRTAGNILEIDTCKNLNIDIKYNVGYKVSLEVKPNSSSWLLNEWEKFVNNKKNREK